MAKRNRKNKMTAEEIEAQRLEAHGVPLEDGIAKPAEAKDPADELDETPEQKAILDAEDEARADREEGEYGEIPEEEEEVKEPTSVVADKYKLKYAENAKANGATGKAAKRSSWDWLAQRIAEQCLGEKDKINIDDFINLLECNGVDHTKWPNRNQGWEGRLRMTGRVVLQKVVANAGVLKTMTGESVPPPEWVERYKSKN